MIPHSDVPDVVPKIFFQNPRFRGEVNGLHDGLRCRRLRAGDLPTLKQRGAVARGRRPEAHARVNYPTPP